MKKIGKLCILRRISEKSERKGKERKGKERKGKERGKETVRNG